MRLQALFLTGALVCLFARGANAVCSPAGGVSTLNGGTGTISTTSYPRNDCRVWRIVPYPNFDITLTFDWRDFDDNGDKVEVWSNLNAITPLLTLSGETNSDYVVTYTAVQEIVITIVSDGSGNCCDYDSWGGCDRYCDGFRMTYAAVLNAPICTLSAGAPTVVKDLYGTVYTTSYSNNDCKQWRIVPFGSPAGNIGDITLTFDWRDFDDNGDKVEVWSAVDAPSPSLTLSGDTNSDYVVTYYGVHEIVISLESDGSGNCCDYDSWGGCDRYCDGFRMTYVSQQTAGVICTPVGNDPPITYAGMIGTIETDDYPNDECKVWHITPFGSGTGDITLTFDWFRLLDSGDKVQVYSDLSSSSLLFSQAGRVIELDTVEIFTGISQLVVMLETDSSGNNGCAGEPCDGFKLDYAVTVPTDSMCVSSPSVLTSADGTIQTSSYRNLQCSMWRIAPFGSGIGIITLRFDWREFESEADKVQVFSDVNSDQPLLTLTGNTNTDYVTSFQDVSSLVVVMETDGSGNCCDYDSWGGCDRYCDGFRLLYSSNQNLCALFSLLTAPSGTIQTVDYNNNMCMRWVIDPFPPGKVGTISLVFDFLEFYNSYDNVKIYRGGGAEVGVLLHMLSARSLTDRPFTFSSVHAISVVIQTNDVNNCCDWSFNTCLDVCDGFRMTYSSAQQFDCNQCDGTWATCVNGEHCECITGYEGTGLQGGCNDVNECDSPAVDCVSRGGILRGSKCFYSPSTSSGPVLKAFGHAQDVCSALGGQLASIHDETDNSGVWTVSIALGSRAWIGLTDFGTSWMWVDGSGAAYSNWEAGAPGGFDCVAMLQSSGEWTDSDCSAPLPFVCEIPTSAAFLTPATNNCESVLAGSECNNMRPGYNCTCPVGYFDDGLGECQLIHECDMGAGDCGLNEVCSNASETRECVCRRGYEALLEEDNCTNINECETWPCHANATCTDNPGSFACTCNAGFRGDGLSCNNINECTNVLPDPTDNCDEDYGTCADTFGSFECGCVAGWTTSADFDPNPGPASPTGFGTVCFDADECSFGTHDCDGNAACTNFAGGWACACNSGYAGTGQVCQPLCTEAESGVCNLHANCIAATCSCPEGLLGDGQGVDGCTGNAWTVRFSFRLGHPFDLNSLVQGTKLPNWDAGKGDYVALFAGTTLPPGFETTMHHEVSDFLGPPDIDVGPLLTINAIFENATMAELAKDVLINALTGGGGRRSSPVVFGITLGPSAYDTDPRVYRWVAPMIGSEIQVAPTGFEVLDVYFQPNCKESGCWVVDITMTAGFNNFNVWYLPRAIGDDSISYDFDYDVPMDTNWTMTAEETFEPALHPCRSHDYTPDAVSPPPAEVTACCLPEFLDLYRPSLMFAPQISGEIRAACSAGTSTPKFLPLPARDYLIEVNESYYESPTNSLEGGFSGLTQAEMVFTGTVDPFLRSYTFTLYLDEVETRRHAGMLRGTVGVEHAVDTFIGLANFNPTGIEFLDPSATQVNLHLEKTNFFTVSTHGTNDYTFLEYVNLRLVTVYEQDNDFADQPGESTQGFIETNSSGSADYIQVTFTLGVKYEINANSDLVPLDSVRASTGTFFDDTAMVHKCQDYDAGSFPAAFDARFTLQSCAPNAAMCNSPSSIPDQFVSYNIPLGLDYFPEASSDLSANVFVHMVISATVKPEHRTDANAPNDGGGPYQMKTTLSASIPVVAGGLNIFCDGLVSKTDLKDVASVDIVVGSASSAEELTRLRIKADIASTQLDPQSLTRIDSDSIEDGLMTLVLKGNTSYFKANSGVNAAGVSLELEDVVTIHIMQSSTGRGEDADRVDDVATLLAVAPEDNSFSSGLDTNGYNLNGAFSFTIDRASQRAHLEPTAALLEICPFNPLRPGANAEIESCITRRDVQYRRYPARAGSMPTAVEICANVVSSQGAECAAGSGAVCCASYTEEEDFMESVLGDSNYARTLAQNYTGVLADAYELNQRFRRAYFINPGYEWTPTQTGGASIFSLSQFVYLFALITLDEGLSGALGNGFERRRMLLQASPDSLKDAQASVGGQLVEFPVTTQSILAKAFNVPEDRVATFSVMTRLTEAEACMDTRALQNLLRETLVDVATGSISAHHTLQVTSFTVDLGGVLCSRRANRQLKTAWSAATADAVMLVVFEADTDAEINLAKIAQAPGIEAIAVLTASDSIDTSSTVNSPPISPSDPESSSSSNVVAIAAAVGGAVGGGIMVAGAFYYMRNKADSPEVAGVVNHVDVVNSLKAELEEH